MAKIKQKTRKAIAKRFKITKKRKVKSAQAFKGHLLTGKRRKRKRALSKWVILYSNKEARKIKSLLPYS